MNRLTRKDYRAPSRMDKACSSKRTKSICGAAHRRQDSQRKLSNRRKAADKTSEKKRRSKSALPPQGQRKSMPQRHVLAGQRKRRTVGHNSSRAEIRNQSAYELKMYLEDNYDCVQHTNSLRESPKEPVSKRQNTKVPAKTFFSAGTKFKKGRSSSRRHQVRHQARNSRRQTANI